MSYVHAGQYKVFYKDFLRALERKPLEYLKRLVGQRLNCFPSHRVPLEFSLELQISSRPTAANLHFMKYLPKIISNPVYLCSISTQNCLQTRFQIAKVKPEEKTK